MQCVCVGGGGGGRDWRQKAGVGEGAKQKCKITNLYFHAKDHFLITSKVQVL